MVKEEGELYSATGNIGKSSEEDEENLSTIVDRINEKYHTKFTNMDRYCNLESTMPNNGMTCAQKAKSESEYFKTLVKKLK